VKILIVHNYYQQPGGEDQVFRTESALLREYGHEVVLETVHNDAATDLHPLALGLKTIWNAKSYRRFRELVRRERPAIVHFHNTFPLLSPAVYYASRREGASVVQTLHNYRLICPAATLFRDGDICELCVDKTIKWPAVQHGCYRGRMASGATAALLATHHWAGTWHHQVDAFVAVSSVLAEKVVAGGLPAAKVHVKPNCIHPDPGHARRAGGYALFLGRLTPEKGIGTLLEAWRELGGRIPLKIAGDGPLASDVAQAAATVPGIEWLGQQTREQVLALLYDARCLIAPSIWYEGGIPLTVLEAMGVGLPIIASRLGTLGCYLDHGRTGLLFAPQQPADLVTQVRAMLNDPLLERRLATQARTEFETHFSGKRTYEQLMELYHHCHSLRKPARSRSAHATNLVTERESDR
jgi:glycosyltransferase involved in cell wall biosynthesis